MILFAGFVIWENGWAYQLWHIDRSKIAALIGILFITTNMHCGIKSFQLSQQINIANNLERDLQNHSTPQKALDLLATKHKDKSVVIAYLEDVLIERQLTDKTQTRTMPSRTLAQTHIQPIEDSAEYGWFMSDAMIKLGLLGTVVGFIIMLQSLTTIDTLTIDTVRSLLFTMSGGMATALYTTLCGLIAGLLIALQYRPIDQAAQKLVKTMNRIALLSYKNSQT